MPTQNLQKKVQEKKKKEEASLMFLLWPFRLDASHLKHWWTVYCCCLQPIQNSFYKTNNLSLNFVNVKMHTALIYLEICESLL